VIPGWLLARQEKKTSMSSKLSLRSTSGDFIVVWIVEHDNIENNLLTNEFHRITNSIKTFNDANKCINYIQDAQNEHIFLVISDSFTQEVVSQVHDLRQLDSIYIFHPKTISKSENHNTSYTKLKGPFPDIACLCDYLIQDIRVGQESTTPISILSSQAISSEDLNTLDPSFMYSQLLQEILLELHYNEQARRRFIQFCREKYVDNVRELAIINQFERDYENHSPAWWYTRECFLYKMLNEALRTQNIDILCQIGFFIGDLHKQIKQLHSATPANAVRILYRGQG
jgi:hypothetical protein